MRGMEAQRGGSDFVNAVQAAAALRRAADEQNNAARAALKEQYGSISAAPKAEVKQLNEERNEARGGFEQQINAAVAAAPAADRLTLHEKEVVDMLQGWTEQRQAADDRLKESTDRSRFVTHARACDRADGVILNALPQQQSHVELSREAQLAEMRCTMIERSTLRFDDKAAEQQKAQQDELARVAAPAPTKAQRSEEQTDIQKTKEAIGPEALEKLRGMMQTHPQAAEQQEQEDRDHKSNLDKVAEEEPRRKDDKEEEEDRGLSM